MEELKKTNMAQKPKHKVKELPEFILREFRAREAITTQSIEWVERNRKEIDPRISFIEAVELRSYGIDVTQIKIS